MIASTQGKRIKLLFPYEEKKFAAELSNNQKKDWGHSLINPEALYSKTKGKGINVCLIDTGIVKSHPDLTANIKKVFNPYDQEWPEDRVGHGCASPDTYVSTNIGTMSFEDLWNLSSNNSIRCNSKYGETLIPKDHITAHGSSIDGSPKQVDVLQIHKIPVSEEIVKITTKSGTSLKLTPWHRVPCWRPSEGLCKVRTDKLELGDLLLSKRCSVQSPVFNAYWYMLGVISGDGCILVNSKDMRIDISMGEVYILKKIIEVLDNAKLEGITSYNIYDTKNKCPRLMIYGNNFVNMVLSDLNCKSKSSLTVKVPLGLNSDNGWSYIAGLLDSDGNVSRNRHKVRFCTSSYDLACGISSFLQSNGIVNRITLASEEKLQKIAGSEKYSNVSRHYQVSICGIYANTICNIISEISLSDKTHIMYEWEDMAFDKYDRIPNERSVFTEDCIYGEDLKPHGILFRSATQTLSRRKAIEVAKEFNTEIDSFISDWNFDSIISIEREQYEGFFYDFSVEGANLYQAGIGGATLISNTHCAGIIGAIDNDIGVIGIAPECNLFVAKGLDDNGFGDWEKIAACIQWAVNEGADIINMSLGDPNEPPEIVHNTIKFAVSKGVIIVAAAGNDPNSKPSKPTSNELAYPARYDEVIAVAALDKKGNIAYFSHRSKLLDFIAPGVDIYSCYPPKNYAMLSGTSQAAPMISGVLALLKAKNPEDIKTYKDAIFKLQEISKNHLIASAGIGLKVGVPEFANVSVESMGEKMIIELPDKIVKNLEDFDWQWKGGKFISENMGVYDE